jgi:hypothetical protein
MITHAKESDSPGPRRVSNRVADPHHVDAGSDPDPACNSDADPEPDRDPDLDPSCNKTSKP